MLHLRKAKRYVFGEIPNLVGFVRLEETFLDT